jgi:HEPN domain-containing protein
MYCAAKLEGTSGKMGETASALFWAQSEVHLFAKILLFNVMRYPNGHEHSYYQGNMEASLIIHQVPRSCRSCRGLLIL